MKILINKLNEKAVIPTSGSRFAAGYDLYACVDADVTVKAHSTVKIGTGLSFEIPTGYFAAIFARSGLSIKSGLRPANCVGVCDSDYRGEYIVALHNDSETDYVISNGDRIAQLIVLPYMTCEFVETDSLSETERNSGGFGSSGK